MKATVGNMETYSILTMLLVKESRGLYLSEELWFSSPSDFCVCMLMGICVRMYIHVEVKG